MAVQIGKHEKIFIQSERVYKYTSCPVQKWYILLNLTDLGNDKPQGRKKKKAETNWSNQDGSKFQPQIGRLKHQERKRYHTTRE